MKTEEVTITDILSLLQSPLNNVIALLNRGGDNTETTEPVLPTTPILVSTNYLQ